MARIRYQPATKTKGFQPIQLSTAGISRMREETNRVVGGMQQNLKAEQEQQKKNLQAMQDNAAYTEQITKENRAIEIQNLKNEQLSITQTAERDAQQAKYDADATQTILTSIVDFSETAAKKAAENTAKQLKDQTDAANAVDIAPLLIEDGGKYEEAVGTAKLAGRQQFSEDLIEGAQSGEPLDATYRKLASNAGLGTIGRRILANRLYEAKHGIFSDRAFGSDEKLYELNGKKFSGLEALNDRQMTAVVQAKVTRDLARDMRETLGVTELLYFTEGKTAVEKKNALQLERSGANSIAQDKSMLVESGTLGLSTYEAVNGSNAYTQLVAGSNYTKANSIFKNALVAAPTEEAFENLGRAPITGQNGKATTFCDRYSNICKEAKIERVQRIDSNNNKARLARERAVNDFALQAHLNGDFEEGWKKNPHAQWVDITKGFTDQGMTPPQYLKNAYSEATTKYNQQQIDEYRTSKAIPSDALINAAKGTHQTALKALKKEAELRKFGGQSGKDALAAQTVTAKGIYKLSREGPNSAGSALLAGVLEAEWKDIWKNKGFGYATDADTIGKQVQIVNKELQTKLDKERKDPTARFYIPDVADRNDIVLPNLFPDYKDYQQMKTLVDKKFAAQQSVGEITSTPSLLAKPSELATLSRKSETSTDLNYPPLIMYVAAKTGRLPSEIANAQIEANNFNYGTKTPLITPNIKSQAIDEASKYSYDFAKEMTSDNRIISARGTANYTQQLSAPGQGVLNSNQYRRVNFRSGGVRGLAALVSSGEGSATSMFPGENYPEMLDKTIGEVVDFQKEKLRDGRKSAAVGSYQFLYPETAAQRAGLSLDDKFTPENQLKMFVGTLLNKPGRENVSALLQGTGDDIETAIDELSQEFASIEYRNGRSYYEDGVNKASISRDQVRAALLSAREEILN